MSNQIMLGLIIVGVVGWIAGTLFALKKDKMLALAVFFAVPTILMFIWIIAMIIMLTIADRKTEKERIRSGQGKPVAEKGI